MNEQNDEINLLEDLYGRIIPKYEEAHGIMAALLDFPASSDLCFVDLGCGFGGLTRRILESFPSSTIFCVDIDELILQRMKQKLAAYADQIVPLARNLNDQAWMQDIRPPAAILSSFTLDFLTSERRQALLIEAFQLLDSGGRWVSCEFYRSPDARVNRVFYDLEIRFIRQALEQGEVTKDQLDRLAASNRLRHNQPMMTVDDMKLQLQAAGFSTIDVPWRFLNLAMVSGIKASR
ncbi:MAG: class I SAM-dependent methyltransferase [candidate division KSB1 bacterium]|nr:class I SAM-dependent methyltransferase [candidate division KSB1 bacterium]